jgi:hypothetical protein
VDGARFSTAEEELPTVLNETAQASDPAGVPCKRGGQLQKAIHITAQPSFEYLERKAQEPKAV